MRSATDSLASAAGERSTACPARSVAPRTYVAGLFESFSSDQPLSALVPAPDWLRIEVSLASQGVSAAIDDASFHCRTLDFKRGALVTESRVESSSGLAVRLRVLRLVSLHSRALGLQVIQLEVVTGNVEATLEASFEGLEFGLAAERLEQNLGVWQTNTTGKRLAMAAAVTLRVDGQVVAAKPLGPLKWSWTWTTQPGQVVQFERMVAVSLGRCLAGNTVEQAQDQPRGGRSTRLGRCSRQARGQLGGSLARRATSWSAATRRPACVALRTVSPQRRRQSRTTRACPSPPAR